MKTIDAVVVLSGGQDSTTCLYWALDKLSQRVLAVTFDYGQRHYREIDAATKIAKYAGVEHEIINVRQTLKGTSPLVSDNELEQYADHQSLPGGLEKTFVPMRNQLFLTIAANRAYVHGTHILVTGVSAEDYGGYPDCRRSFINKLEKASSAGTFTGDEETLPNLEILTPLMYQTKKNTVAMALEFDGCYEALALSHTAYDGAFPPVGSDHASLLRAKGFEEAGVPDPLVLRAWYEGYMDLPTSHNYDEEQRERYLPHIVKVCDWLAKGDPDA